MRARRLARSPWIAASLVLAALAGAALPARADRRNFTFSYDPMTLPKGALELEQYLTASGLKTGPGNHDLAWTYQLEAEYGVTDHFDLALYQVFGQDPGQPLAWKGYKARARWRPTDPGDWPIDPLVYVEWVQDADGAFGFEEKLVLGRTFGRLVTVLNVTFEQERLNRSVREYTVVPSVGVGYQVRPWLTLGVEALSQHELGGGEVESTAFAGPVVSLAGRRAWVTLAALARVAGGPETGPREDYRVRLILGLDL
ncbi:MAG TPA: hypothetical protein VGQ83_30320 [Polyangia bacterium]